MFTSTSFSKHSVSSEYLNFVCYVIVLGLTDDAFSEYTSIMGNNPQEEILQQFFGCMLKLDTLLNVRHLNWDREFLYASSSITQKVFGSIQNSIRFS